MRRVFRRADSVIRCSPPILATKFAGMGKAGLSTCWEAAGTGSNETFWGILRNRRTFFIEEEEEEEAVEEQLGDKHEEEATASSNP